MYISNELTALAIVPGLLIIGYVYGKDRVEKEPISLILKLMAFGVASCVAAGFIEAFAAQLLPQYPQGSLNYALLTSFALAAFWEEIVKYLALRLGSWKNPNFNYRFDGIVYGVSAAVGFAVFENVMYVAQYGFQTAVVRAFTAVPLHAFCGVFMGIFYAYAKQASIVGNRKAHIRNNLLSLIVPMLIHGTYDTFAFLRSSAASIMLLVFVAILWITAIRTIKVNSLADYRAGFYPRPREIKIDIDL